MITDNHSAQETNAMEEIATFQSDLMTEAELIEYLRIPTVSKSKDYRNVIYRLKRYRDLPRIHICGQPLFPREAIQEWIRRNTKEK